MTPRRATPRRATPRQADRPFGRRLRHGFTLIELLVVIAILAILMAVAFPAIAVMQRMTRGGAAENTVGVAVRTAAAYAAKPKRTAANPSGGGELASNGAAVLFTPSGEIRILETDLFALARSNGSPIQNLDRYGYRDIEGRDYIILPNSVGVVGIVRDGSNDDDIKLLSPPFAIRFNQSGQLTTGFGAWGTTAEHQMVYYDGNGDGLYDNQNTSDARRSSLYDPDEFDIRLKPDAAMDAAGLRVQLPFERIETVAGLLLFNQNDFRREGLTIKANNSDPYVNNNAHDWLMAEDGDRQLKNARAVFFSRSSGSMMKELR